MSTKILCDRCGDEILCTSPRDERARYSLLLEPENDEAKQSALRADLCGYCASVVAEVARTKGVPR